MKDGETVPSEQEKIQQTYAGWQTFVSASD